MTKYNLITDASELAKTGKELAAHIRDTDERIAVYLLSEVAHIEVHRNPTRLNQFFSMVRGSGARINAMHNFIQVFANVSFHKEANSAIKADGSLNDNNKFGRKAEDGSVFAWYYSINKKERFKNKLEELQSKVISKAEEKPWFMFQPEREPVQFDADKKVISLLKSLWSTALKGDVKISKDLLNGLTNVAFETGVIEKPSDILSDDTVAKVPAEYRAMLHIVGGTDTETKVETPAEETVEKPVSKVRPTAKTASIR